MFLLRNHFEISRGGKKETFSWYFRKWSMNGWVYVCYVTWTVDNGTPYVLPWIIHIPEGTLHIKNVFSCNKKYTASNKPFPTILFLPGIRVKFLIKSKYVWSITWWRKKKIFIVESKIFSWEYKRCRLFILKSLFIWKIIA